MPPPVDAIVDIILLDENFPIVDTIVETDVIVIDVNSDVGPIGPEGPPGPSGTSILVQEDDVTVVAVASSLDFEGDDFNVTQAPTGEANITLSADVARDADVSAEAAARAAADSSEATTRAAADAAQSAALTAHLSDTSDAHDASAVSVDSTTLVGTGTDVQAVLEELDDAIAADVAGLAAHLADASDAHDASAVSVSPTGGIAATDVQAALAELDTEKAAVVHVHSGSDITTGTVADARIASTIARDTEVTAAIVAHEAASDPHPQYLTAAEGNAAYDALGAAATVNTALTNHLNDASDAHDASAISILDTANDFTATDVEGALAELQADAEADDAALAAHLSDATDAHDASAISILDVANDFTATDVEGALAELQAADELDEAALAAHLADTVDAHDASAISFTPNGSISATNVQDAIQEVRDEASSGSLSDAVILLPLTDARNTIVSDDVDNAALRVQGAPGATALGNAVIKMLDSETGLSIADWDASGSIAMFPDGTIRLAMDSRGIIATEADSSTMGGTTRLLNIKIDGAGSFGVLVPGNGVSVQAVAVDPADVALSVSAATGQTAAILELNDENGDVLLFVEPVGTEIGGGHFHLGTHAEYGFDVTARLDGSGIRTVELVGAASGDVSGFAEWLLTLDVNPDGSTEFAQIGVDGTSGFAYLEYTHEYSRLRARAHTGQTEPLIKLIDESGNDVVRVLPAGAIGTAGTVPADGAIPNGMCFLYFDPTNGAAAVKFKGKTLDGTVVTSTGPMT